MQLILEDGEYPKGATHTLCIKPRIDKCGRHISIIWFFKKTTRGWWRYDTDSDGDDPGWSRVNYQEHKAKIDLLKPIINLEDKL